jgi:hypothetical protein
MTSVGFPVGEELSLEDEKLDSVVQSINDLVRRGNRAESPLAILFPFVTKLFPSYFRKVMNNVVGEDFVQRK